MNNYPILTPLHQEGDTEDNTQHPHAVTRRDAEELSAKQGWLHVHFPTK